MSKLGLQLGLFIYLKAPTLGRIKENTVLRRDNNFKTARWLKAATMASLLALSPLSLAESEIGAVNEDPSALAMGTDLLVIRPVMLATTVIGSAVWLVSLPFSAAGGNMKQAADTLVVGPGKATFVRCLGCVGEGYDRKE